MNMLRRNKTFPWLPDHYYLRGGNGTTPSCFHGLGLNYNIQADGALLVQQARLPISVHSPEGPSSAVGDVDLGRDLPTGRLSCKPSSLGSFLGFDARRSTRIDEKNQEWQDLRLHRSTFTPVFSKLSLADSPQFSAALKPGNGRYYGVPAYQDAGDQSGCESSDVETDMSPTSLDLEKVDSNLKASKHGEAAHQGFAKVTEREKRRSSADARDLSKVTSQKLTGASVSDVLQEQSEAELAKQFVHCAEWPKGCQQTAHTCNSMLMTFSMHKNFTAISTLLKTMRCKHMHLNNEVCSMIIKDLAGEQRYQEAMQMFETAKSFGCQKNAEVYNCYLDVLYKAGQYDRVEAVAREMQDCGHALTVHTYNILIDGFGKAQQVERACRLFDEMKAKGYELSRATRKVLLDALGIASNSADASRLWNGMTSRNGSSPLPTYTIFRSLQPQDGTTGRASDRGKQTSLKGDSYLQRRLVPRLCKESDLEDARKKLREGFSRGRTPPMRVFDSVLSSLWRAGKVDAAVELFQYMREKGSAPDRAMYNSSIIALCRAGRAGEAVSLQEDMVSQGLIPSTRICNELIAVLFNSGELDQAFGLLSKMEKDWSHNNECKPDSYTYKMVMSTLCNGENPRKALEWLNRVRITAKFIPSRADAGLALLQRMKEATGVDKAAYDSLIRVLCLAGRVGDAHELLLDMRRHAIVPGVKSCRAVLQMLGSSRQVGRAWTLFLQVKDLNADMISYSIMIKFLVRAGSFGKARKLLEEMKSRGLEPSTLTYTPVLDCLGRAGRLDQMCSLFQEMNANGCQPDTHTYNCLLHAFAYSGQVDRAYQLFEESIDRGCIPNVDSYNPILRGYFGSNRTEEALDLYSVMKGMGCVQNLTTYDIVHRGLTRAGLLDMASEVLAQKLRLQNSVPFRSENAGCDQTRSSGQLCVV